MRERSGQGGLRIMENIWNSVMEWGSRLSREARPLCGGCYEWRWSRPPVVWLRHRFFLGVSHCLCTPASFLHWETFYWTNLLRSYCVQLDKKISYIEWKKKKREMFLLFCLDFLLGLIFDMDPGHCNFLLTSYHELFCLNMFLNSQHVFFTVLVSSLSSFITDCIFHLLYVPILTLHCLQYYYCCSVCILLL